MIRPVRIRVMKIFSDIMKSPEILEINDDYRSLQAALGGGYLESVRTSTMNLIHPGLVMLVDEEGHMKGLPVNFRASMMYMPGQIVGDVLLLTESKDREVFLSLPPHIDSWADIKLSP